MPEDPTPDGQGILNKPQVKPFPEPTPRDEDKDRREAQEKSGAPDSLATPDMEEPADTVRPPLGN